MSRELENLIRQIENGTEDQRRSAAMKMGRIRTEKCVDPLLKALHDESKMVRATAIQSLSWIQNERMIDPLVEIVKRDTSELVIKYALEVLARVDLNQNAKVRELFESLKDSNYNGEIKAIIESTLNKYR